MTSSDHLSVATYTCTFGHRFLDGSDEKLITCVNGTWMGEATECSRESKSIAFLIEIEYYAYVKVKQYVLMVSNCAASVMSNTSRDESK